jgi:two-component system, cell cycle sensor histidine kinase and response regulator CckA
LAPPTPRERVPKRTLLVSAAALGVPVGAQWLAPAAAVEYELLLWLVALIPAFLLAYHRGWRGATTALALGMAVLSTTQAALTYLGDGVRDWGLMLAVVAIYVAVSIGIGWVTELLHRARDTARAMEHAARESESRSQDMAARLHAVAEAATGVLGARVPAALDDVLRDACAQVVPFDYFGFQLYDARRDTLVSAAPAGGGALLPGSVLHLGHAAVRLRASQVLDLEPGEDEALAPRSVVHVPIVAGDRDLGLLSVGSGQPFRYAAEDVRVLEALAACAAGALLNIEMLGARDAADHAVRVSEARFRSLVEDASELILILDAEGRIRYESPAVWRLVGHRRGGRERNAFSCLHQDDRVTAKERFGELLAIRSGTATAELRVRGRDGEFRHLEVLATNLVHDPAVGGVVINARDVTVQRHAAVELRESEHRYRRFFENDLTGDYLADPTGAIIECNPRFAEIFGIPSASAARGHELQQVFADGPIAVAALVDQLHREGRIESMEFEMRRLDGEEVQAVQNVVGVFDASGRLEQIIGYVFDVTEHRRTEDQLRHAQKLEAIGQLAGGVAHDFNNVLMAIIGFASLLESSVEPGSAAAGYASDVQESALRAADLTHQLLAFSRRQVLQPQLLDPDQAVRTARQMLSRLLPENISIDARLETGDCAVKVDPTQFQQVLLNLAVNARDAMPQGGAITITTGVTTLSAAEASRLPQPMEPGDYVRLSVADTGHGMDARTLRRVFEPFYTTKEPGSGTGLGLSTVYGIVRQSGGHVSAESEPGVGTTFTLLFPRHAPDPDAGILAEPEPVVRRIGGTVLLAEDEEAVRVPLRRALELAGFSVISAADGEEALRLAEAYGSELDFLVTDAIMPRMGGARLAEELRKRQPELSVVVVSGYPDRVVQNQGGLPDRCIFLQKPVLPARLVSVMHEAMALH